MKKALFAYLLMVSIPATLLTAQVNDTVITYSPQPDLSSNWYQKANNQKTFAWILLGVGTGTVLTAFIVKTSKLDNDPLGYFIDDLGNGAFVLLAGGAVMASSIPLFIISGRNKRKANLILRNESSSFSQQLHSNVNFYSLGINIKLSFKKSN